MRQMYEMVEKAKAEFGNISYCGKASSWEECFTIIDGDLMFWFNVGKDTKCIREPSASSP